MLVYTMAHVLVVQQKFLFILQKVGLIKYFLHASYYTQCIDPAKS